MNIDQFNREQKEHAEGGESQYIRRDEAASRVLRGECRRCGDQNDIETEGYCASCVAVMRAMRPLVRTIPSAIAEDPE